jgi:hypothetical protein
LYCCCNNLIFVVVSTLFGGARARVGHKPDLHGRGEYSVLEAGVTRDLLVEGELILLK